MADYSCRPDSTPRITLMTLRRSPISLRWPGPKSRRTAPGRPSRPKSRDSSNTLPRNATGTTFHAASAPAAPVGRRYRPGDLRHETAEDPWVGRRLDALHHYEAVVVAGAVLDGVPVGAVVEGHPVAGGLGSRRRTTWTVICTQVGTVRVWVGMGQWRGQRGDGERCHGHHEL